MTFLQPWLLAALPLITLPVIIHLINQRRYQTMPWAAMLFLLAANRLTRGYARIRQWLVLACRMLAIAGLVLAASRPLASGWLGWAVGTRPDTTLILLDRSASMAGLDEHLSASKLETARRQLADMLALLRSNRWVLIDSVRVQPRSLQSPRELTDMPGLEPTSATADIPRMLQAAYDYLRTNRAGRTEIWICSDLRASDWNPDSGRWARLQDAFQHYPAGVRFHLLTYPQAARENFAIRVYQARRRETDAGAELLVSLIVRRTTTDNVPDMGRHTLPVQFEINGARFVHALELTGDRSELRDHRIHLEREHKMGWGVVALPADTNPADNRAYFVFDQPVPRKTLIVAENPTAARPLQLAVTAAPDPTLEHSAEVISADQLSVQPWESIALVLWQGPLPTGEAARLIEAFVNRGGRVVFFPPSVPTDIEFFTAGWQDWVEPKDGRPVAAVSTWRTDQDLLANTLSGRALPLGRLQIRRYCRLDEGSAVPLATLDAGTPLLVRMPTARGGVYLCTTTPSDPDSNLANNGVVLYVALQRALSDGADVLGRARYVPAGPTGPSSLPWQVVSAGHDAPAAEYSFHAGVYQTDDTLLAVTRPANEDDGRTLSDQQLAGLLKGLDYVRLEEQAGSARSLVQEVWRLFLAAMLFALLAEAVMCLPKVARAPS